MCISSAHFYFFYTNYVSKLENDAAFFLKKSQIKIGLIKLFYYTLQNKFQKCSVVPWLLTL